jgi:predicted Zn-dependent protease
MMRRLAIAVCGLVLLTTCTVAVYAAGSGGGGSSGMSMPDAAGTSDNKEERKRQKVLRNEDYKAAVAALEAGRYAEGFQKMQALSATFPDSADVFNYMGFASRKQGQTQEAAGYYAKALSLDPKHLGAHEYMGELYLTVKDLDSAEKIAERLKKICPKKCEERDKLDAAIASFKAGTYKG